MQAQRSHYFLSPVLVYDGPQLKAAMTRALVSPNGIFKVFEEGEEIHKAFLTGKEYQVRLDGHDFPARLVRESGPGGTHYNLHILKPEEKIQHLLERYGFASPWKRDFARIPVSARQCEAPTSAILSRFSGDTTAEVRNFSYHGIFLQLSCALPSNTESVGQRVKFRLLTSRGRLLDEATARIARIYDEIEAPSQLTRGLGLRILDMPESARKAYHGMILESCRELSPALPDE
jgi:hypothetical protein